MRKLLLVYNPRSSRHEAVEEEVLGALRGIKGWMVGKYEVSPAGVDENTRSLAKLLGDGDLVVTAGGDGTATIGVNAIMISGKRVKFGALGYGNFNDMAQMLGTRQTGTLEGILKATEDGQTMEAYPLDVVVDGEHWRYVMCYATFGLFAESTEIFDEAKIRKKLQSGKRSPVFSWWNLAKWYFKNRKKRVFVPKFRLNGREMPSDVTDYVAVNGTRMAGVMKGKGWYQEKKIFGRATGRLRSFWRLVRLMSQSIMSRIPTVDTEGDVLELEKPGEVEVQAEGEYRRLKNVSKIEIKKASKGIEVVKL